MDLVALLLKKTRFKKGLSIWFHICEGKKQIEAILMEFRMMVNLGVYQLGEA